MEEHQLSDDLTNKLRSLTILLSQQREIVSALEASFLALVREVAGDGENYELDLDRGVIKRSA